MDRTAACGAEDRGSSPRIGTNPYPGLSGAEVVALVPRDPVLVCYRGAHSHGTFVPTTDPEGIDDIDIIACYIQPDLSYYFGLKDSMRGHDKKIREWDSAAYEIRHLAKLLAQANPNVLSMLWMDEYIELQDAGRALIAARELFATKAAGNSFTGYMHGQIKRMTAWHDSGEATCCDGETFHEEHCKLRQERGRGSQKKFATGFMGAKRKGLVQKFGYDAKNAAHAIRLGRMGIEFLQDGVLRVKREDAAELIEIKNGGWPLARVQEEAGRLFALLGEAKNTSPLPDAPDMDRINALLVTILSRYFHL
jgi:hypothetical protein